MRYHKVSTEDRANMRPLDAVAAALLNVSEWFASKISPKQVNIHRGKKDNIFKPGIQREKDLQASTRLKNASRATGQVPYGLLTDKSFDKIRESEGAIYNKLKTHLSRFTQDGTLSEDKAFEFLLERWVAAL